MTDGAIYSIVPGHPKLSNMLLVFDINVLINVMASILTLCLFWFMRRNGTMVMNLYLKCVLFMTVCQMTYDISIFPILHACSSKSGNKLCTAVFSAGYSFGGAGAAVWSMYLIVCAIFTVETRRPPSAKEQFYTALGTNVALGVYAIPYFKAGYGASSDPKDLKAFGDLLVIYNYVRLALIVLSFAAVCRMGKCVFVYCVYYAVHGTPMSHV
jgi:hypothetical protein